MPFLTLKSVFFSCHGRKWALVSLKRLFCDQTEKMWNILIWCMRIIQNLDLSDCLKKLSVT